MSCAISARRSTSFKRRTFPVSGYLLADERADHIHGQPCLRNTGGVTLLRKGLEILDAAVKHIERVHHPQLANFRHVDLTRTAYQILRREPTTLVRKSTCFTSPVAERCVTLPVLRCDVFERRNPCASQAQTQASGPASHLQ